MELVFSASNWTQVYTLENCSELIYRYHDLRPWIIVLDEKQIESWNQELLNFFNLPEVKVIHIAETEEVLHLEKQSIGRIARDIKPMTLEKIVKDNFLKIRNVN